MASSPKPPAPPNTSLDPPPHFATRFHQDVLGTLLTFLTELRKLDEMVNAPEQAPYRQWMAHHLRTLLNSQNFTSTCKYLYNPPNSIDNNNLLIENICKDVQLVLDAVKSVPSQIQLPTPPDPSPIDVAPVVTAVEGKLDELKKEQAASFKSFSEAVRASPSGPPPTQKSTKPQATPKPAPPRQPNSSLPQAVIRYQGSIDNRHRPIYVKIVESLNVALASSPGHKHVLVVGVKWTPGSNLVVRARAPSTSALVSALEAVRGTLEDDHRVINDIIPNTRWSRVIISHVYSGKESISPAHSSTTLHQEFASNNPAYAALTIRQAPSWIRAPSSLKNGQHSSVSFAFDDPDSSLATSLVGTSFTAFGNLRCPVKPWVRKKKTANKAAPPHPVTSPRTQKTRTPAPAPASASQIKDAMGLTNTPSPHFDIADVILRNSPTTPMPVDHTSDPGTDFSPMRPPAKRRKED